MPNPELITMNDGHSIPQIGLGVFQMSNDEAHASTLAALEAGYRHIDTAAGYRNEQGVGAAIRESGIPRDEVFVTTKLQNGSHARRDARAAIEQSLEALGMDHVDLYLIHWPQPSQGRYTEAWESLIDFRSEGLVTSIGVSNFLPDHLDTVVDETGIVPVLNQIELHPTFQPHDLINHCSDLDVVVESWSPLGAAQDLDHPEIVRIAESIGATPAQVIIAWHLHRGFVVIPKSRTPERIVSNFAALDVRLNSEQLELIDGLDTGVRIGGDPAVL
ncbi:aldo/keto reductase [Tessaracoccus rhinocerotis]|uniref:Aldo/keto reductase n=1 Tax=Tessaracoccus rhinocerotis TaxID=1689449 RepID=A0A553K0S3_9ACTN|nr:aldo/keto reductase [Tessaracoccus rhinocerotis]TRY18304.1 aldo/keto reductase [Tessaracoccus rhinocerotis]